MAMPRMLCLLVGLLFVAAAFAVAPPSPLRVDLATTILDVAPHVRWYADEEAKLELADALAALDGDQFTALAEGPSTFGFVSGAMWFAFDLEYAGDEPSDWLLVVEYTLTDRLTLFRIDQDGSVRRWHGGDRELFSTRGADHRYINWRQHLGEPQRLRYLIRAESESSMQLPLVWARPDLYLLRSQSTLLGLGMYFGVMLALATYNLILYLSVRDRNFLYYVLYVASVGAMLLSLTGLSFQYLWPEAPDWANIFVLLTMAAALASMLQFSRRFLDLATYFPLGDRLCLLLMYVALALALAAWLAPYAIVVQLLTLQVFPAALLIYLCGIACLRRFPPARYFLAAWTFLLAGIMTYAAVALGWLPKTILTEYAIHFGSATEMILLSFALAYRINVLTSERVRSQGEAQLELEARVAERTSDLDAALRRLESANRQLEDFSRRDGLTGVFNRRSFEHILQRAEAHRLEHHVPFAVLMIDADHFKNINDQFGHLVGDDCLRHIAQVLEPLAAAAGGQIARFGGEEFAVVVSDVTLQQAAALARGMCSAVAEQAMVNAGRRIPITVSVGVAMRHANSKDAMLDVVRRADTALYQAKQSGRNRVAISG